MFFSRLFRSLKKTKTTKAVGSSYKPALTLLEDRITPSGFYNWFTPPTPGPATHLVVEAPHNVKSGQSFEVEVEAVDAKGRIATGYTGTVALTLGSADASATLPANETFTASDRGVYWFQVTLAATGYQTIIATDTTTATITGNAATYVNPAPTPTSFVVQAPQYAVAGGPITVTVTALDQYHHVATGYTGTVQITSNDGLASLPANVTFTAADDGTYTFTITYNTVGAETFVATDTTTKTITGQATVNVEAVGAVTHFGVFNYGTPTVGQATSVVVVALDASNHVVAGYTGTVSFSSSDTSATLPANYTFVAADDGRHTVSVTFATSGSETLTAKDTVTSSITGVDNIYVNPVKAKHSFGWGWGW